MAKKGKNRPVPKNEHAKIAAWNKRHPRGTIVKWKSNDMTYKTCSEAYLDGGWATVNLEVIGRANLRLIEPIGKGWD